MKGVFLVGGYPNRETFKKCFIHALEAGFDFIEVGIPFSEPVADGPVIAGAIHETLKSGIKTNDILNDVKELQKQNIKKIPVYFMTYSNIVFAYGYQKFSEDFGDVVDGILLPDVPNRMHQYLYELGFTIPVISFVTPESRPEDIEDLKDSRGGFIYFIGIRGITGGQADLSSPVIAENIGKIKAVTDKNVIMGFGIKTPEQVKQALSVADGFVVGTAAVSHQKDEKDYRKFIDYLLGK